MLTGLVGWEIQRVLRDWSVACAIGCPGSFIESLTSELNVLPMSKFGPQSWTLVGAPCCNLLVNRAITLMVACGITAELY